jgi:valyl-tRNA synthetase
MARMQELVRFVRDVRNRTMLDPRQAVELRVRSATGPALEIRNLEAFLSLLAGTTPVVVGPEVIRAKFSASKVFSDMEASIPLEGLIDPAAEKIRLEKQLAERRKALESTRTRLANPAFVDKAPTDVVAQLRQQLGELEEQVVAIQAGLTDLG